jgi:hypothetical protein
LKQVAEEFKGHLARSTTFELVEATEHVITVINNVRLELNVSICNDGNCFINIMALGMRTEFRQGSLLENLYLEDRQETAV